MNPVDRSTADELVGPAIAQVATWLEQASAAETSQDARTMNRLQGIVADEEAIRFVMEFVDRVVRSDDDAVSARVLDSVVRAGPLPAFLGPLDRMLLRLGSLLGRWLPGLVMPLARRRMRAIVGHLVAPADHTALGRHLGRQRSDGYAVNVNLLGEAVLGEREAQRRLDELLRLIDQPEIDYVSVKTSAVASQLNHFAHDDSLRRVVDRLRHLVAHAGNASPPTFINFDMEEYHDLALTTEAFRQVLDEPDHRHLDAGIVLQAYLPDTFPVLQDLTTWANGRHRNGGGVIKIRLVKGANLAMERVDAAMHGWPLAPYGTKAETDANYKRCIDWLLRPDRMAGVRLGLASHNLFDVAWTKLVAEARGVGHCVQFEMLQGMAPSHARTVAADGGSRSPLLLYTPAVAADDFDVAIGYLFRRLEENAADENFIRHLFAMEPGSPAFEAQADRFRQAVADRSTVSVGSRRTQDRLGEQLSTGSLAAYEPGEPFVNAPETDPVAPANRPWIEKVLGLDAADVRAPLLNEVGAVDLALERGRAAGVSWRSESPRSRRQTLHRIGDELERRRDVLVAAMMHEARKTFVQADGEVSEAVDFARWYGDSAVEIEVTGLRFTPLGVIAVVPPWNFPVAIPAGGVLAAIAAGNAAILKPAPETPRCAELVVEACRAAGVPDDVVQLARTPDDVVGQQLVMGADGVILTGSTETADLFRSWKPDLNLFAETSGKNSLVITPAADLDLAVADLVASAFGHSGQKCSAASLAILVGGVGRSERFRRQLVDAVESLTVGPATAITTDMGPLIAAPNERLARALTQVDSGESWLVEPRAVGEGGDGDGLYTPGVRDGVTSGSWFARTECFGPVLGLVHVDSLDEALAIQNAGPFALTAGLHSLDPNEVEHWVEQIEVGNAYVNRPITGAIVARQPFGGWKRSSVGPGAKAGGVNYVRMLGTYDPIGGPDVGGHDFDRAWSEHFAVDHDPVGLFCESNIFRYRPLDRIALRFGEGASVAHRSLVTSAAAVAGVTTVVSEAAEETQDAFAARLGLLGVERVRLVGEPVGSALSSAAVENGVHLAAEPVSGVGRIELLHYVREQAVSRTLHRFGNLAGSS